MVQPQLADGGNPQAVLAANGEALHTPEVVGRVRTTEVVDPDHPAAANRDPEALVGPADVQRNDLLEVLLDVDPIRSLGFEVAEFGWPAVGPAGGRTVDDVVVDRPGRRKVVGVLQSFVGILGLVRIRKVRVAVVVALGPLDGTEGELADRNGVLRPLLVVALSAARLSDRRRIAIGYRVGSQHQERRLGAGGRR
jgi:hypothetical protein